jgi:hypoxanthine phosphoribosyltransferase
MEGEQNGIPAWAPDIVEVVYPQSVIQKRVQELGAAISKDYAGKEMVVVGILKGVLLFLSDLVRAIDRPLAIELMAIGRYGPTAQTQGVVQLTKDLERPIKNCHVLFIEDIVDTGLTMSYMLKSLKAREPASLKTCVLFNRPAQRLLNITIDYCGFEIGDEFLVGYGLDYHEAYRHLPFVGRIRQ